MNLPHYVYFAKNSYRDYEFYSDGPNVRIKKVVMFNKLSDDPLVYNLASGDEDPVTGLVSDLVVSNNKDTEIVLATAANTVVDFCNRYGSNYIFVAGSTDSGTRERHIFSPALHSRQKEGVPFLRMNTVNTA